MLLVGEKALKEVLREQGLLSSAIELQLLQVVISFGLFAYLGRSLSIAGTLGSEFQNLS